MNKILKIILGSEAVLFDMDGVVFNTNAMHDKAKRKAVDFCKITIKEGDWDRIKQHTSAQIYSWINDNFKVNVSEEEFVKYKSKIFKEIVSEIEAFEGVFDFIEFIKNRKIKTALVTASRRDTLDIVSNQFDLKKYFDVILTREDVVEAKPNPAAYLKASQLLKIKSKKCTVLEDSTVGIQSGKAAGCRVIGKVTCDSREKLLEAGAELVFEKYSEFKI